MPFTVRSPAASHRVTRAPYLHSCRAASPASLTLVLSERFNTVKTPTSRPGWRLSPWSARSPCGLRLRQQPGSGRASSVRQPAPQRDRRLLRGHPERRGLLGAEERHRGGHPPVPRECAGATVNYNPTGSGAGIKQFIAGQVDFAGSDSALKTEEKDGVDRDRRRREDAAAPRAWNLPMVTGPIAIAYNVNGVDKLILDPRRRRQDLQRQDHHLERPGHRQDQPGRHPAVRPPIKVFFRSDESGTTENFTKYLARRGAGRLDRRPGQEVDRQGRGQGEVGRRRRGREVHRGLASPTSSGRYAKDNDLEHRPGRQRRRRRSS